MILRYFLIGQKINDVTGKPVENSYYKVHEEHGTYVDADGHKVEYGRIERYDLKIDITNNLIGQKINDVTGKPVENSYYKVHEEHATYVDADGHKVEYGMVKILISSLIYQLDVLNRPED